MKIQVIRGESSPADREINYLVKRLEAGGRRVELVDADSREGIALCELYDIVRRPSVMVTDSDGRVVQSWHGQLPTYEDVSFWASS